MTVAIQIGDKLRNNDPRANGKTVSVVARHGEGPVDKTYAVYFTGKRFSKVRFDRIKEVGEPTHNQGWTRLPRETADIGG